MNNYYNQSKEWTDFFLKANPKHHNIITIEHNGFKIFVYEYPYVGNSKFWYLPRFMIYNNKFTTSDYISNSNEILKIINQKAKDNKISYITMDVDNRLLELCGYSSSLEFDLPFKKGSKKLQYLQTPILDVQNLEGQEGMTVQECFKYNEKNFFGKVNKTCRNLTRRALEKNWEYEVTKDSKSFEQFWSIWQNTAKRHSFNLHPKQYIVDLLSYNWAQLIVLKDEKGVIQSGGIIVTIGNSTIHLYGANTDEGLNKGSQYFFHVLVLKLIKEKQLKGQEITTYDLGGSDDDGYGNFKKSYKPDYLTFDGVYDIVNDKLKVSLINSLKKVKKLIKST